MVETSEGHLFLLQGPSDKVHVYIHVYLIIDVLSELPAHVRKKTFHGEISKTI